MCRLDFIKNKRGITLIALIVTIIVLLILAGISINLVIGNNGLFSFMDSTKHSTDVATERDQLSVAIKDAKSGDYMSGGIGGLTVEGLQDALDDIVGEGKTIVTSSNETASSEKAQGLDICFVVDISASMNDSIGNGKGARMEQLVKALNSVLSELAKNEKNRIQVVTYSSANTNAGRNTGKPNATARMNDFSKIEQNVKNNEYFTYKKETVSSGFWGNKKNKYYLDSIYFSQRIEVVGGTYTQDGIYKAYEEISSRDDTTNVPVLILLTDGTPTYASSNYLNNPKGTADLGDGSSDDSQVGRYTIEAGRYVKDKIWGNEDAYFFTIGMGIDESDSDDLFPSTILNPTESNIEKCKNSGRNTVTRKLYDAIKDIENVNYVTQAFLEGEMDATVLTEKIGDAIDSVVYAEGIQVWFEDSKRVYKLNPDGTVSEDYTTSENPPGGE